MAKATPRIPHRPEVLAFLTDAKENPDDDTPRLVLADWLTDHDDPRGEFVQLQVESKTIDDDAAQRAEELLEEHRGEWIGILGEKGISTHFLRGLVRVGGSPRKLLSKRLGSIREYEPFAWVDELSFYDFSADDLGKLHASPHWGCLSCLDLGSSSYYADSLFEPSRLGEHRGEWSPMADLPMLEGLTEFEIRCQDIGVLGARALQSFPTMDRLRKLDLGCNNLGDDGMIAFAESRCFPKLTELDLEHNRVRAEGYVALADWPGLDSVRTLRIYSNYPGAEGISALANSTHLANLETLRLGGEDHPAPESFGRAHFGPVGAAALAGSTRLTSLRQLFLPNNAIGPAGAEAFVNCALPSLVELDLAQNEIGDAGAVALAGSSRLSGLTSLNLRFNGIGDTGARALAESPYLENLTELVFRANWSTSRSALVALHERFGDRVDIGVDLE